MRDLQFMISRPISCLWYISWGFVTIAILIVSLHLSRLTFTFSNFVTWPNFRLLNCGASLVCRLMELGTAATLFG